MIEMLKNIIAFATLGFLFGLFTVPSIPKYWYEDFYIYLPVITSVGVLVGCFYTIFNRILVKNKNHKSQR